MLSKIKTLILKIFSKSGKLSVKEKPELSEVAKLLKKIENDRKVDKKNRMKNKLVVEDHGFGYSSVKMKKVPIDSD